MPLRRLGLIRPAEHRDLAEMLELCALHAEHEGLAFAETGQVERWKHALFGASPALFAWVVEAEDGLDGYMTATLDYSTWNAAAFVYLDCLYLRPAARGGGVGRRLIETLRAFARDRRITELQWQTPRDNQSGIGFYDAIGARALPKLRFALSVDESSA